MSHGGARKRGQHLPIVLLITADTLRTLAGLAGLLLFAAIEIRFPCRKRIDPIFRHYRINLSLMVCNAIVLSLLVGGMTTAYAKALALHRIGLLHHLNIGLPTQILLTLVFLDGVTYLVHIASHLIPLLWRFHRVHHTDRDLDVTSASRFHPVEIFLSIVIRSAAMTLWGPPWEAVVIFEGTLFFFAQWGHSNFTIPKQIEPMVRFLFVTPDMHRLHHSDDRAYTDSNYSTVLSCWDRIFRTYTKAPRSAFVIGLTTYPDVTQLTFLRLLTLPFRK
jgi:sterol desaturase/sphingolipid hydroxylase (fatty acid hydroxylase superfamily)